MEASIEKPKSYGQILIDDLTEKVGELKAAVRQMEIAAGRVEKSEAGILSKCVWYDPRTYIRSGTSKDVAQLHRR